MAKSIKRNYILNLTNTILGIIFPLITFPYVTRVLMADGIGLVNFYDSIISYITLFTALGIPLYAIRETARVRDDVRKLSITTSEILILHVCLSFIGYIAVGIICLTVTKVSSNIPLFLLLSTSILLSALGVNWFYQGVEEFKYITVRNIIVKIITIALLFILVRDKDDLSWYAFTIVAGNVGNNIFNFLRLRKYVHLDRFSFAELKPIRHIKPALKLFVLNMLASIYAQLDVVMLGFIKDAAAVGFFTVVNRITGITLSIAASLGTILLPRLSNLIQNSEYEKFYAISQKAVEFLLLICLPIVAGLICVAPTIIRLFCGSGFEPSIQTLALISPRVIAVTLSNVIGIQILYPQGKENLVIISTAIGAVVSVILNLMLIPIYSQDGAAISIVITEFLVLITQLIVGRNYIPVKLFTIDSFKLLFASIIMAVICFFLAKLFDSDLLIALTIPFVGALIYLIFIRVLRVPIVTELQHNILGFINRKK